MRKLIILFESLKLPQDHKIHLLVFKVWTNVSKTLSHRASKENGINIIPTYKVVSFTTNSINLC